VIWLGWGKRIDRAAIELRKEGLSKKKNNANNGTPELLLGMTFNRFVWGGGGGGGGGGGLALTLTGASRPASAF